MKERFRQNIKKAGEITAGVVLSIAALKGGIEVSSELRGSKPEVQSYESNIQYDALKDFPEIKITVFNCKDCAGLADPNYKGN